MLFQVLLLLLLLMLPRILLIILLLINVLILLLLAATYEGDSPEGVPLWAGADFWAATATTGVPLVQVW